MMGKDTIDRANRVLARITERREGIDTPSEAREKNRKASAMLNAIAGLQPNFAPMQPIKTDPRRTITIGWSDYMDGPEPTVQVVATARSMQLPWLPPSIKCICCGAPASEVQHD